MKHNLSIFKTYFQDGKFVDRFKIEPKDAIDVLIPVAHTNELWEQNLKSIYREIPINRLLIGDGGCIDDSIKIVKKFPRVKIYNHQKYTSLGYSIKKLIEEVKTDWFIYLHSDVYLPKGWFKAMKKNQKKYDWFECRQHLTILVDYLDDYAKNVRPFSGSQMGRKNAFKDVLPKIDDDYLYRNEDMIFAELVKQNGFKYGRVKEITHYHQIMNKKSKWQRKIKNISIEIERNKQEKSREWLMQIKGIIKYTQPDKDYHIYSVRTSLNELLNMKDFNFKIFEQWVEETNPKWLPYIENKDENQNLHTLLFKKIKKFIFIIVNKVRDKISSR